MIAVEHPGCIIANQYQKQPVQDMMRKGMMELTVAPGLPDAWRSLFQKGDVVGIKVSPVGGRNLCSDGVVLREIIAGLNSAGVPSSDILVFNRYREETIVAGRTFSCCAATADGSAGRSAQRLPRGGRATVRCPPDPQCDEVRVVQRPQGFPCDGRAARAGI